MKIKILMALSLTLSISGSAAITQAAISADEKSDKICSLINDTMILANKCTVDKAAKTVNFGISLEPRRAIMLCLSLKRIAYSNGWNLPTDWKININAEKSGEMSKAECAYKETDLFG